ncbi:sodium/solute symporter [Flavobacteriaceae bacterium]|jgi:SSS family solute:Na+ symporter|nr:sodium/solute symporter [Flavobacteriaceae bacterium]MDA8849521.1 sodium/solute symporter [Flavobacteriaceae bacterium]|tara:strand:+ start:4341 stop:5885 length:1545 start_codon:yes stop_codon:yes gene_type:complete
MIDLLIVALYFTVVIIVAISGKQTKEVTTEEYFLSSRSLKWPSIAFSTIATNIQGYQFLGMMGSAYLYGLAQASLEINAIQGILFAAFIFVPYYLKDKIVTITQFIKSRLGKKVALVYSLSNILLFSTITIGAALFWGAYAADIVFGKYLSIIHGDRLTRIAILILVLGIFSTIYTYLGGLTAVVRTDIIQFVVLLIGGIIVMFIAVHQLGGWSQLYIKTPEMMHLHLPSDHEKLPWTHVFGLFLLNINYWCANQSVIQRSLAAKSLKHAQIGLIVGGLMKYFMAIIIVVPGIALVGILGQNGLSDPDMAFPYLVNTYLPMGAKGLVLCALFASLMSTVDSTFNSLATLWSIDIYKEYINKNATDLQTINAGKRAILFGFTTGATIGIILLNLKFSNPDDAFTHTLNELRYYINCGIVVLICAAIFLVAPKHKITLVAFFATIILQLILKFIFPDMNYFVRAMWVILISFFMIKLFSKTKFKRIKSLIHSDSNQIKKLGLGMLISLILLHIIFH